MRYIQATPSTPVKIYSLMWLYITLGDEFSFWKVGPVTIFASDFRFRTVLSLLRHMRNSHHKIQIISSEPAPHFYSFGGKDMKYADNALPD